jgi:AcrR family transcriptional regulator
MRTAIIEVAGELVSEQGVDGLSIRELAKRLGYSAGAIYDYFASREEILARLYFQGTNGLDTEVRTVLGVLAPDATAMEQLIATGHAYRNHALAHPELYRLIFGGIKQLPIREHHEENVAFDQLIRIAVKGVAEGEFADQPVPLICAAAWAAVHGFVSLEITGHVTGGPQPGSPIDPEEGRANRDAMFAVTLSTVVRGLASEAWLARNPPVTMHGNPLIAASVDLTPDTSATD